MDEVDADNHEDSLLQSVMSEVKVEKLTCQWILKPFSNCLKFPPGQHITSAAFKIHVLNKASEWSVSFCPHMKRDEEENEDDDDVEKIMLISLKTQNVGASGTQHQPTIYMTDDTDFTFSLIPFSMDGFKAAGLTKSYMAGEVLKTTPLAWTIPQSVVLKNKDHYLFDDTLIIQCKVHVRVPSSPKLETANYPQLGHDLGVIIKEGILSDVTLVTKNKNLKAHKVLLAARSPVFKSMFTLNMIESKDNIVHMTDVDGDVMELVLQYIYSGNIEDLKDVVEKVVPIADKYFLKPLLHTCEELLYRDLTLENVTDRLMLADFYNMFGLRNKAVIYAAYNYLDLFGTPKWAQLEESHPTIISEVTRLFAALYLPAQDKPHRIKSTSLSI